MITPFSNPILNSLSQLPSQASHLIPFTTLNSLPSPPAKTKRLTRPFHPSFNTVIAIATQGFYLSYAMPLIARLISYFSGTHRRLTGPWAMSPAVSLLLNSIGLTYLLFACITFNFPYVSSLYFPPSFSNTPFSKDLFLFTMSCRNTSCIQ